MSKILFGKKSLVVQSIKCVRQSPGHDSPPYHQNVPFPSHLLSDGGSPLTFSKHPLFLHLSIWKDMLVHMTVHQLADLWGSQNLHYNVFDSKNNHGYNLLSICHMLGTMMKTSIPIINLILSTTLWTIAIPFGMWRNWSVERLREHAGRSCSVPFKPILLFFERENTLPLPQGRIWEGQRAVVKNWADSSLN